MTRNETPVTRFGADTARALLAYLAVHSHVPHRRETLAGLLWPDQPESEGRHNLSQALNRLRVAIGDRTADPPFLTITRQEIGLGPDADIWLDVTAFREALAVCHAHAHGRIETCDACAERLEDAAALYKGEFLAGFTLDSALFEEWLVVEREELHRGALEALHALAEYHAAQGAYERAVAYGRRQIELEGWREDAHRQVMRGLALSGDRAGALAQYKACCRALDEALGIEPEAATTALCERIRAGEKLQPASVLPPHNLPTYLTPFLGREAYLAEIADRLANPECRLLSLVGPGGIGKTRLAVEAARGQLDRFADGVFFVPLVAVQSTEGIVPAVARAIGFSFYGGGEPKQQLLDYLRRRQMLLILDNVEHLLAGAELATEFPRAAPGVRIVTTTRARLNVRGEHLLSVGGMRYPETLSEAVSGMDQYGAVQLFLSSARETRPDFRPTTDDLAHVARICRLVHGMPLAILLAAAWVGMLTPSEIAGEIVQALDFLAADWRDVPVRQRSIRAALNHSWRLLSEREQAVLQGLSVFRGGFTRQAAQQVTGASLRDLMVLLDRSLLHREPSGRYAIHELLRQYAAERLERSSVEQSVRDRHCAYYVSVLEQFERESKSARQDLALASMDLESENARAAWDWAVAQGHTEWLDRALEGLAHFYDRRFRFPQAETAFRQAAQRLSVSEGLSPEARIRVLTKALAWQSLFVRQLGHTEHSLPLLRQALSLLEAPELAGQDTRAERAFVLFGIGWSAYLRNHKEAERRFSQSLALYRALDNQWWTGRTLRGLSDAASAIGDFEKASRCAEESIAVFRALGDQYGLARSGRVLSVNCAHQGRVAVAERVARESFAIPREWGGGALSGHRLSMLGVVLHLVGKYAEAQSALEKSVPLLTDQHSYRRSLADTRIDLGRAKMHLGEYKAARAQEQMALALAQQLSRRKYSGVARLTLGQLSLVCAAYADALALIHGSVVTFRETGRRYQLREALASLGYAARGVGDDDQARCCLYESLQPGDKRGSVLPVLYALPAAALLRLDQGQAERAVELYALASRYAVVANSRWFEDVAGRQIAATAAALPPDVVAAAQERGQARDLWITARELLVELEA